MKLISAFLLLAAITLSEPFCLVIEHEKTDDPNLKCKDPSDGSYHALGTRWRNRRCDDCLCEPEVVTCCSTIAKPTAPRKCVVMFDQRRCKYDIHKKRRPSVACRATGSVGK
eukprot:gi/632987359/ref/XP_007910744.1/ PREDICTED: beta-microseminoprotein A1-like [Callorhinchus milii]